MFGRTPAMVVTAALIGAGLLLAAGCSGGEPEPANAKVVVVKEQPKPEPRLPAAPEGQAAAGAQKEEREVGNSLLHAPGDYLTTTVITVPRNAKKKIYTAAIGQEIQQFRALEGRFPLSLKELEQWRDAPLPETPRGYTYHYDSNTGELGVVPIN